MRSGGHSFYLQARNEPDVYETSDLPEDDQAEFDAVRLCAASGSLWTLPSFPQIVLSLLWQATAISGYANPSLGGLRAFQGLAELAAISEQCQKGGLSQWGYS